MGPARLTLPTTSARLAAGRAARGLFQSAKQIQQQIGSDAELGLMLNSGRPDRPSSQFREYVRLF